MKFDNIILTHKFLPTAYFADNLPSQFLKKRLNCTKYKRPNLFSWKLNDTDISISYEIDSHDSVVLQKQSAFEEFREQE
jgi:hypothetical protein